MSRKELTSKFWQKQTANIGSMLLHKDAPLLDSLERTEILSYLPSFQDQTVLDLGCGIGRFTGEFAKHANQVVALDFSNHFIEKNKEQNPLDTIKWICSDVMDVSFKKGSFDLIFISWLFMYLKDEELLVLSENLRQWLKPTGHLFFRESCAAATHFKAQNGYYAHYRSLLDYERFFKNWKLVSQGSIQTYEETLADPFKCFWLYRT